MGCLKNIIKCIILILALIGVTTICNNDDLKNKIGFSLFQSPSQEKLQEKAADIADLSRVNNEYKIKKTAKIMGVNAVIIEHPASKQKMVIVDTGKKELLTKKDFQTKAVDKKLKNLTEKIQYQFIRVEDLKITQRGLMHTMGQQVPYVKFSADTVNLPMAEVQGIIGVATDKNGHEKLILSLNDGKKYSQIITQEFYKNVR